MTMDTPGLVSIRSGNSVKVTLDRLEAMLKAKGITVFARIDHAARRRGRRHATSPDRAADLRRSNGGHGTYAARADYWHRPAPEGAQMPV